MTFDVVIFVCPVRTYYCLWLRENEFLVALLLSLFDHEFFCQNADQTPDDVEIQVENKEFMDEFFVQVRHP